MVTIIGSGPPPLPLFSCCTPLSCWRCCWRAYHSLDLYIAVQMGHGRRRGQILALCQLLGCDLGRPRFAPPRPPRLRCWQPISAPPPAGAHLTPRLPPTDRPTTHGNNALTRGAGVGWGGVGRIWSHCKRPGHGRYRKLGDHRRCHGEDLTASQERTAAAASREPTRVPPVGNEVSGRGRHRARRSGARQRALGSRLPSRTGQSQ